MTIKRAIGGTFRSALGLAVLEFGRSIKDVLIPRGCAGCSAPDEVLCSRCSDRFSLCVKRVMPATVIAGGNIFSCSEYSGVVRHAILQWKDHNDLEVGGILCEHLKRLTVEVAQKYGVQGWPQICERPETCEPSSTVAVVPAPSSAKSIAARGRLQTLELAYCVVQGLHECGIDAVVVQGLGLGRQKNKSVQVSGVRSRQSRAHSGIVALTQRFPQGCSRAVLVDDICTTGSTLLGCARSLRSAGFVVEGAVTLASVSPE